MIRVGVIGAAGRMGRLVCGAVDRDPDLSLVAAVGPSLAAAPLSGDAAHHGTDVLVSDDLDALAEAGAQVAVDFSTPAAVMGNVRWAIENAVHAVVGTTGIGASELAEIGRWLSARKNASNVIVAPNFAIGAVLVQRFAAEAARLFPAAEIIELHHEGKLDAPSGTSVATAERMAKSRTTEWEGPDSETVEGVRGGSAFGTRIHSVRLPGLVAHQEVLFGGDGQTLSIRHDTTDRESFMPGVVLAIKAVMDRPGLTIGLEPLLGLEGAGGLQVTHRLAAVYAHPDDDTYGLAGTYALNQGNLALTVIVASSGEAGPIADSSLATREHLAEIREREELAALAAVGADGADVHFLRFPDGGLSDAPHEELVESITGVLREARPQVVVTFGPEGITRHPDHITVGQATTEAFHNLQAEAGNDAFHRLLYTALPQSAVDRFFELMRASNPDFGDPDDPFMPRGVPDHTVTVRVDCSSVRDRKIAALTEHRTQAQEFEAFPRELRDEVFGVEWFVQAWPPVTDPGGQTLSSIFHGLVQA